MNQSNGERCVLPTLNESHVQDKIYPEFTGEDSVGLVFI